MDDREIVSAIRARIAERIGRERYELWFGSQAQLAVYDHVLAITVPSQFVQDWLRSQFRKDLEFAAVDASGAPLAIEFRVVAPAQTDASTSDKPAPPIAASVETRQHKKQRPATEQAKRRSCLSSFVVGSSNCLAFKATQVAVDDPGHYSPLLLCGQPGSGKTHLLEGTAAAFRQRHPRAAAVYLSAEQFTSDFLEALRGSGLPSFRRKYRGLDMLAVDDLSFFVNKRATLVELLHTLDTLTRTGKQVIFAADRPLTALKSLGPELCSRLVGGVVCPIDPAEFATRLGIVRGLASRMLIDLPEDVANYVAGQLTSQARELVGAVRRLHATSLAHNRPITLAMAQEALIDLIDQPGRFVKLSDIDKAVCDVFGLNPTSLKSDAKTKTLSQPRMLAMWLARKHTRSALSEIGAYFGRRSHSTVISAQKKVEAWMAGGAQLRLDQQSLGIEESIRRVEEQLRAG